MVDEADLPIFEGYLPALLRPRPLDSRRPPPISGLPDENVRDLEVKGFRLRRLEELGRDSRDGEGRGIEIRKGKSERSRGSDSTASLSGIRACAGLSGDLPVMTAPKVGAGLDGRLRLGDDTRFDHVQDEVLAVADPGETDSLGLGASVPDSCAACLRSAMSCSKSRVLRLKFSMALATIGSAPEVNCRIFSSVALRLSSSSVPGKASMVSYPLASRASSAMRISSSTLQSSRKSLSRSI